MYKKIIVAFDDSDTSYYALQEAIKLTKEAKADLLIIHVVEENFLFHGGPSFDYGALKAVYREEGQRVLDKAKKVMASHSSIKFEAKLIELISSQGRIAEVIAEEAANWSADLLVLGTHGRRGFSRLFIGSVAENTVRIATTPVLLIRSPETS